MNNNSLMTANLKRVEEFRANNQANKEAAAAAIPELQAQLEACRAEQARLKDELDAWQQEQDANPAVQDALAAQKKLDDEIQALRAEYGGRDPRVAAQEYRRQAANWESEWKKKSEEFWISDADIEEMNRYEKLRGSASEKARKIENAMKNLPYLSPEQSEVYSNYLSGKMEHEDAFNNQKAQCDELERQLEETKANLQIYDANDARYDEMEKFWKENFSEKDDKYNIGHRSFMRGYTDHGDIRNLPNGANFRIFNELNDMYSMGDNCLLSKSYYMNKDYLFTNNLHSPIPLGVVNHANIPEIQPLIINEFQPDVMTSIADLIPSALDSLGEMLKGLMGGAVVNIGRQYLTHASMKEAAKDPSSLYQSKHKYFRFTKDPVQTVRNMFMGGKWLNTFEVPYYGSAYLHGDYKGNWKVGGAEDQGGLGKTLGGIAKSFGIDYPGNPRFEVSMESSANRTLKTSFYLINSNSNWLKKNFKFLHALFAGTSWVHLNYCMLRPANVYNVLCPGRFMLTWATMSVVVTTVGKLRYNVEVSKELGKYSKAIDKETLWPDAWKVAIDIKELSPNNFNMYADYYLNGFNKDELAHHEESRNVLKMFNEIKNFVVEKFNEITNAGAEAKNMSTTDLTDTLQNASNKAKTQESIDAEAQNKNEDGGMF